MATRSSRCSRSYQRLNSASSDGSMSIDVSSIPFPASGIFEGSLTGDLGGHVRDRSHHCVPDAGIVERMAGALDATNFGTRPQRRERMRRRRRTQKIVTALHDDAGNPFELPGFGEKLTWLHLAVGLKIMRFHERRGGGGRRRGP